ncbi:class I SAM-dependent methyltransferase [Streptomyces sp. AM 4-1-1]|uniref:class I SAM-dependent methyltransferase n=1 Tax=Streptomyces sp. AM 4-1-1 TaxID=3028710 RepID=UPI0023B9DCA5|nr:class I SAM-dependent methyltransferase [Streptomyces sp. AM 4-1-1]WEH33858.1 class I SAM-dependent methyltransferase [Streptomyces sp. AM 4-1-1]
MPSLLRNRLAERVLRPAFSVVGRHVDQRMERTTHAVQNDLDALHHEVADLRRRQYGLTLLLDGADRGTQRMPTATEIDTLVREVRTTTGGGEHARREVTSAYRTVVALEALGIGRLPGSTSDVCGKLATVPLLSPPGGDILEIGPAHGLFAAALVRMMHRAGAEPRLTIVGPATDADQREDVVRANLALGGVAFGSGAGLGARLLGGLPGDTAVRTAVADREYGVIVVSGDHSRVGVAADLEWAEEIAASGAVVVLDGYGGQASPGVQDAADRHLAGGVSRLRMLGRVATTAYLRAG